MPVSSEVSISGPFVPNGVTTAFPFDFKATAASEVVAVDQDGALISPALYTVTLDAGEGGTLTFATAPLLASYSSIFVVSDPALTQPSDFDNAGPSFNPAALTRALDRAAARDLKQQREIDRTLKVPFGEQGFTMVPASSRASNFLAFDGAGNPVAVSGAAPVPALATHIITDSGQSVEQRLTPIVVDARGGGLSDVANLEAAFAEAIGTGRDLVLRPGFDFRVNDNITFEPFIDDASYPDQRNRRIFGYGARLRTVGSGAQHLLRVGRGYTPFGTLIEGLVFDARGNTELDYALLFENSTHLTVRGCTFFFGNNDPFFDAVRGQQRVADDIDTGSFWTRIDTCTFRKLQGADDDPRSAIHLRGTTNATHIVGCQFGGAGYGVLLSTQDATLKTLPNGLRVIDNDFEGLSDACIEFRGLPGGASAVGALISLNRIEQQADTTFLRMTGATVNPASVTVIGPQYFGAVDGAFTFIDNPNNIPWTSTAISDSFPEIHPDIYAGRGTIVRSFLDDAFQARPAAGNHGFALYGANGLLYSHWRSDGADSVLSGIDEGKMLHGRHMSVSSSGTRIRQIMGSVTFAGETSKAVTFPYFAEADALYGVNLMPQADPGGRFWVSGRATTGFTINFSSAFTGTVLWELRR